jgi:predicted ATP-binding protein involved in virulence
MLTKNGLTVPRKRNFLGQLTLKNRKVFAKTIFLFTFANQNERKTNRKMKLHKVEIRNFRCFGAFRVDLVPDVTIFIGKNGSGKSTLIHAIKYGLSFIFSKDKKVNPNGQSFSASAKGLDMIAFTTTDAKYNMEKHDYCYPVSILCNATDTDSSSFGWGLIKENIDKPVSHENYEHAYKRFKDKSEYPVIAI